MKKRSLVAASAAAALGLLVPAAPSMAKPATTDVEWRYEMGGRGQAEGCYDPKVTSDKDISNLVYTIMTVDEFGVASYETFQLEFLDGEQPTTYDLDDHGGQIVEVWVKSGNNKSGDGGLGEYYVPVFNDPVPENNNCVSGGGGSGSGSGSA